MEPFIVNYKYTASLFENEYFNEGIIITAMTDMQQAYYKAGLKRTVISINNLLERLLPSWFKDETKLLQHFAINDIISKTDFLKSDSKLLRSFKANKNELLACVRLLLEIGVPEDALPEENTEQQALKDIYKQFCTKADCGIQDFLEAVSSWSDCEELRKTFAAIGLHTPKCIALQGFQYANGIQARLIKALYGLDMPIYFLNNIDEKQKYYYEVWMHNPLFKNISLYRYLEEGQHDSKPNISVKKIQDNFAMVQFIKNNASDTVYYAPASDEVKEIITTFFTKQEDKKHILAYPAGRYLMDMYSMWNEETETVELKPEKIKSCIATGWAEKCYQDGSRLLAIYDKVSDYFSDCRTIDDWLKRSELLLTVKQNVITLFKSPVSDPQTQRWHSFLGNPLSLAGVFDCSEEDIAYLRAVIQNIVNDVQNVFFQSDSVDLKKHFVNIISLLEQKAFGTELNQEELIVLREIKSRLSIKSENFNTLSSTYLVDAMKFFLGGEIDFLEPDDKDEKNKIILSLPSIESHSILHKNTKAVLCCCDEKNMPGHSRKYPWPLSKEYLMSLNLKRDVEFNCQNQLWYMECVKLSNRYLMHLAKNLPDVELTWIEKHKNINLNPSVYLRQVSAPDKWLQIEGLLLDKTQSNMQAKNFRNDIVEILSLRSDNVPKEILLDNKVCHNGKYSMRLLYDYFLGEHPYYTSKLHLDFYLTSLIILLADTGDNASLKKCADEIFKIFPSRTISEREELLSFALRRKAIRNAWDYTEYDGRLYPESRYYLEYLDKNWLENIQDCSEDSCHYKCYYCPHCNYCFRKVD